MERDRERETEIDRERERERERVTKNAGVFFKLRAVCDPVRLVADDNILQVRRGKKPIT